METISRSCQKILILSITSYQFILSPLLGSRCRFYPSCSEYCQEAIEQHGCIKGLFLLTKRIARCHPWGGNGYDPVPVKKKGIKNGL